MNDPSAPIDAPEPAEVAAVVSPAPETAGPAPDAPPLREFDGAADTTVPEVPAPLAAVHEVPVKVQAVLGRTRMPIGELLRLSAGTVLELDRRVGEPVDVFVNNRLVARGEVVMIDQSLGVTLTEIVRAER
ncbi:MAG: flagellar motor switch protein FliN [Sphingomonas sp.]